MDIQELKEIARNLANQGVDAKGIEDEINRQDASEKEKELAIKRIDEYISVYELYQLDRQKHIQQMMLGGVLLIMGLGSYFVGLGAGSQFKKLVIAVMTIAGGWVIKQGYKKYVEPIDDGFTKDRKFKSGDIRKFYSK